MSEFDFSDPGFWIALAIGIALVVCFVYWLATGARKNEKGGRGIHGEH